MKYTIQNGVEHQFSERVNRNLHYLLPLLVILAGVTFFLLNLQNSGRRAPDPLTLGIYTINSEDEKKTDNKQDDKNDGNTNAAASNPITAADISNLSAGGNTQLPTLPVGGRGGDPVQGATTTLPAPSPLPPSPTVVCSNLSATPILCTACTPPLTLFAGQKALLSSDGTCLAIDP